MSREGYELFCDYFCIKDRLLDVFVTGINKNRYDTIGYICNGGIFLAVEVARLFSYSIPTWVPIIHSSYKDNQVNVKKSTVQIYIDEDKIKDSTSILVVDDICDTGFTLENVCRRIKEINSNARIYTFVVIYKSNKSIFRPDFFLFEDIYDRWWSGLGMDPFRESPYLWFKQS